MEGLGNKIRILRYKKGWSQENVAHQLGVSITYLNQIENDEVDLMYRLLARIARLYNVPIFVLLAMDNNNFEIQPNELERLESELIEQDKYIEELKAQFNSLRELLKG